MPPPNDALSKDDLFLLLESYKNSVEMNTLISQQLSTILEMIAQCKDDDEKLESNLKEKTDEIMGLLKEIREKIENNDKEAIRNTGKLLNRVNLLYVAIGSIVLGLIWLVVKYFDELSLIHKIAIKLGVS